MSIFFRAGGDRIGTRRSGAAAPTGRTERNVRAETTADVRERAEVQQRPRRTLPCSGRQAVVPCPERRSAVELEGLHRVLAHLREQLRLVRQLVAVGGDRL